MRTSGEQAGRKYVALLTTALLLAGNGCEGPGPDEHELFIASDFRVDMRMILGSPAQGSCASIAREIVLMVDPGEQSVYTQSVGQSDSVVLIQGVRVVPGTVTFVLDILSAIDTLLYHGEVTADVQEGSNVQIAPVPVAPVLMVCPDDLLFGPNRVTDSLTVRNAGTGVLSWTLVGMPPGVSAFPDSGSLGPGEAAIVRGYLDSCYPDSACTPPPGSYPFSIISPQGDVTLTIVIEG